MSMSAARAERPTCTATPARIALLEQLHAAHLKCAALASDLGRLDKTHNHFKACREIVLAIATLEDQRGSQ